MNVQPIRRSAAEVNADWIVLGVFEGEPDSLPSDLRATPLGTLIADLLAREDLSTDLGSTTPLFGVQGVAAGSILVVGLGARKTFGAGEAYAAGVAIGRKLSGKKRESVAVAAPEKGDAKVVSALTAGLVVGVRGPDLRKTEPARHPFGSLEIVLPLHSEKAFDAAVHRGLVLGESVNLARDLANTPPAEKVPTRIAERAREVAQTSGIAVDVWNLARIEKERFGGLIGVAAGSDEPPAFVTLEYSQGGDGPVLALVGKGVTFDSGGLSIKTSAGMEDMKADMTGAAVVLATISAAARLKLPVNLKGYLAFTENMTGGKALKLGDVLTMRNGKTVEILNTDAEGRLILADALSYAAESKPSRMLDLATLTGAAIVALGVKVAGLFTNDEAFSGELLDASRSSGERAWRLPLDDDYLELLKSNVADLKNVGGKWGGAITAAKFLQQFVAETPWVHLDIAGPSWVESDSVTRDAGGTGCFVRTLIELIESGERTTTPA